ncbi:unnamed protein product [Scytosiphon promiscuus]
MASTFLKDRRDICVPVDLLAGLIDETSKLRSSARSWNMPDTVCSDLSWPGFCLEDLSADRLDTAGGPPPPPLLVHTSGPENSHLALLRPRWPSSSDVPPSATAASNDDSRGGGGSGGRRRRRHGRGRGKGCVDGTAAAAPRRVKEEEIGGSSAVELKDRLALHAGPIRQISALAPRANATPRVFARCEYSATLVGACKVVDRLHRMEETGTAASRRIRRAKAAAGVPVAADGPGEAEPAARVGRRVGGGGDREHGQRDEEDGDEFDGFEEVEKLVFARRLTCTACSPFTPNHAAFLDEEFRLFHWHADRGAVAHGSGPLPIDTPPGAAVGFPRSEAEDRRRRNADVALDYGSHPRVLWIAGRHRAYRVDLRERPSPAALTPALDPGVYFRKFKDDQIIDGGPGRQGGRGKAPKVRSLAVGRRSAYDVFVGAGLHLACMDVRFPTGVVARWDLPQEVDQLRWLPGVPGEGADAEEVILASARRSPGFYVNTWARDVPGWRGCQARLALDDTSPAASAARRPLTISLPATPLSEGETRSGGLLLALPPERRSSGAASGDGLLFVHATSVGDVYGQSVEMREVGGVGNGESGKRTRGYGGQSGRASVSASPRSALWSDRIQSMLPCGDVCVDPGAGLHHDPPRPTTAVSRNPSAVVIAAAAAAAVGSKNKALARESSGDSFDSRRRDDLAKRRGAQQEEEPTLEGSSGSDGDASDRGPGDGRRPTARDGGASDRPRRGGSRRDGGNDRGGASEVSGSEDGEGIGDDSDNFAGGVGSRDRSDEEDDSWRPGNGHQRGDDSQDSSDDGGGSAPRRQSKSRKRPRRDETPRRIDGTKKSSTGGKARGDFENDDDREGERLDRNRGGNGGNGTDDTGDGNSGGGGGGDGDGDADDGRRRRCAVKSIEYFPVNAAALRAAVEHVPDDAVCGHRRLAPLVDLLSSSGAEKVGKVEDEDKKGGPSAAGMVSALARHRERDFSDLRNHKGDLADFLLQPRTPEELLVFCRRTLGLKFPADPSPDPPRNSNSKPGVLVRETNPRQKTSTNDNGRGDGGRNSPPPPGTGSKTSSSASSTARLPGVRPRMDDSKIAVDVARAVLAWGRPFRNVETEWRAAAVGQGYALASPLPRALPTQSTVVLCSAREVLKEEPSPFLRPGVVGAPLATDVTVEDVRWLKDQWDSGW